MDLSVYLLWGKFIESSSGPPDNRQRDFGCSTWNLVIKEDQTTVRNLLW